MNSIRDPGSLALEGVVRRFEERVRGIGHRSGLASSDMDELFQDIRIRLWRALDDPARIESISAAYVYRTATSAAVDLIRTRRRNRRHVPLDPDLAETRSAGPDLAHECHETAEQVAEALERLDPRRRPVVRMYLVGYNHKEIADLLGWSSGATRNLLYRGLADLRADLASRLDGVR